MNKREFAQGYLEKIADLSKEISSGQIELVLKILEDKLENKHTIFIAGNGGSASTASHMVGDLAKTTGRPFKAICLSDNITQLTATGNDISYDQVFSNRLENLGQEKDLLIVITGSGNSKNIIEVVKTAKKLKMHTMAFLGADGGKVMVMVGSHILIPSFEYGPIEDFHMILVHLITAYFKKKKKTKALFLDRDGVINKKPKKGEYIKSWEEFEFTPGIERLIRLANRKGYLVIVITNQRGIGLKKMTVKDFQLITSKMTNELKKKGAIVNGVCYCPHLISDNCSCRKPKPGLFFEAASYFNIDLENSIMIGDSKSDMIAGRRAGCGAIYWNKYFAKLIRDLVPSDNFFADKF